MNGSVKQALSRWAVLLCALFAGGSAGAFLGDPCRRLDGWGDIEGHQTMFADKPGNFSVAAIQQTANANNAAITDYSAFMNPAADRTIGIRADDTQERLTQFEAVSDSDLDLSVLIAQFHESQFIKGSAPAVRRSSRPPRVKDGPLSEGETRTVTCWDPAGAGKTLGLGSTVGAVRARHCAGSVGRPQLDKNLFTLNSGDRADEFYQAGDHGGNQQLFLKVALAHGHRDCQASSATHQGFHGRTIQANGWILPFLFRVTLHHASAHSQAIIARLVNGGSPKTT
jgi:hypothetical protein